MELLPEPDRGGPPDRRRPWLAPVDSGETRPLPGGWPLGKLAAGYGAAAVTICFVTGAVVTWVRFEAIGGVGTHAVLATDRMAFVVTGAFALLGMAFWGVVLVGTLALLAVG